MRVKMRCTGGIFTKVAADKDRPEVLYLAEIAILVFNEHQMERLPDLERKIKLLRTNPVRQKKKL